MNKPETPNPIKIENETEINKDEMSEDNQSIDKNKMQDIKNKDLYFPRRYIVLALCWSGLFIIHAMRVNIGITVVTILDIEAHSKVGSEEAVQSLPNVTWNSKMIGFLHSVFYIGFILTQIPGGCISRKSFATKLFSLGIVISCILNVLLPIGIQSANYYFTCFIRFCQGLSEGLIFPALYKIMHNWFPNRSIHKYGGWIFGGMYAGPIIGFPIDGLIIHYWRWPFVFYLHSLTGLIWFLFSYILMYETPKVHPTISENELTYLLSHQECDKKEMKIPWCKIFSSTAVWAIITCNFIKSWMFILMLTNEAVFLSQFKFTMVENGIYSAIPHVLKVIIASVSGYLAEILLNLNKISKTNVRKLFNTLGFGIESIMCYFLVVANTGVEAVIFLCIGIGFSGLAVSGWQINFLDIAPELSDVIAGISASFGTLGGIMSPILVGLLTHPQTLENWQRSFILTGSVLAFGVVIFAIFGKGERQNWNSEEEMIDQYQQYFIVIFTRFLQITILGVYLYFWIQLSNDDQTDQNQICQIIIISLSIVSMIIHIIFYFCSRKNRQNIRMNHKPIFIVNLSNGFLVMIQYIVMISIIEHTDNPLYLTRKILLLISIIIIFIYMPIYMKWRPDPDERYFNLSSIISGYLVLSSCVIQILNNNFPQLKYLNNSTLYPTLFYVIFTIFTYNLTNKDVRKLLRRQHEYENLENVEPVRNLANIRDNNNQRELRKRCSQFRSSFCSIIKYYHFSIVIAVVYFIIFVSLIKIYPIYFKCSVNWINSTHQNCSDMEPNLIFHTCINIFSTILTIWYLFNILKYRFEKAIKSKFDELMLNIGTIGHIIYRICAIYYMNNTSYVLHLSQIIQIIFQRFLILEMLQRKESHFYNKNNRFAKYFNICLILSVINLSFYIENFLQQVFLGFYLHKTWTPLQSILYPFVLLFRLYGFAFFFDMFLK